MGMVGAVVAGVGMGRVLSAQAAAGMSRDMNTVGPCGVLDKWSGVVDRVEMASIRLIGEEGDARHGTDGR